MDSPRLLLLVLLGLRTYTNCLKLPPYIKPCSRNDPNINACAKEHAILAIPGFINGDPKYRVPSLAPLLIEELSVHQGPSNFGLSFTARNVTFGGLDSAQVKDIRIDLQKQHLEYDLFFPSVDVHCQYNVSGQVLILPITGSGNGVLVFKDSDFNIAFDFDKVRKTAQGKEYMVPKNFLITMDTHGMTIHLENLFNGNKLLAPYVKPCARSDPEFNKCALKSARETIPQVIKGDRKYKVPVLEPLEIAELRIADSGPRQAGLKLVMTNAKVYGVKDSHLEKTDFDFSKKHVHHEMTLQRLEILGRYNVSGRLLLLPISGNGDINITLENVQITYDHDYTLEPIKGDIYMVVRNATSTLEPSMAYIHLTNLFNGDPLLGTQMNLFLKENWREVYAELSPAVITAFTEIVSTIIRGIAGSVPFDVAFPQNLPAD